MNTSSEQTSKLCVSGRELFWGLENIKLGPSANFVMDKHLLAPSDVLGCNNKIFVPNCQEFGVAQVPSVGVEESTNKMVPHEPLHPELIIRPLVIAKSMCGYCLDVSIPCQIGYNQSMCNRTECVWRRNKKMCEPYPRVNQPDSASGNEIRRPPCLKRIWPFIAASEMKTSWPAWRIEDLRISQAAKQWSSLFLNFLESLTGNRERRNWFPAGDQSNGMAVKRDLRINFRPIGCSAPIMRWFCCKTQEKH